METSNASLFFSAACGLSCEYCYIGKSKSMANINRKIVDEMSTVGIVNVLRKNFGDVVKSLELWGAEPTENMGILIDQLDEVLESFPDLNRISLSSNFYKRKSPESILSFIEAASDLLENKDRKLKIKVQASIDGPDWISNYSRQNNTGLAVTETIRDNIGFFLKELSSMDISKDITVIFNFKSTVLPEFIKKMVEDNAFFDSYWEFFDSFGKFVEKENKQVCINWNSCLPTTIFPGDYTKEDGEMWALFLDKCTDQAISDKTFDNLDIKTLVPYIGLIRRSLSNEKVSRSQNQGYACGAGGYGFSLGADGIAHICHRSFFFQDENYLKFSALEKDEYELGREKIYIDKFMSKTDDEENFRRQQYVAYCFRDFYQTKFSYIKTSLLHLARCNQADKDFLTNDDYRTSSAVLMGQLNCVIEGFLSTGSFHLVPQSILKLWGNGAIKSLMRAHNLLIK